MATDDKVRNQKGPKQDALEPKEYPDFLTLFATPWSEDNVRSAIELTQKYIELVGSIKILNDQFNQGEDRIGVALQMLIQIKHFIEQDETVLRSGITAPLGAIASALRDIQQGVPPKLFEKSGTRNKTKYKDPTATMTVSACAAACMEILMKRKYGLEKSSLFVSIELAKAGITQKHEGGHITADTVLRWRERMTVKNKTVAYAIYRHLIVDMTNQLCAGATIEDAKLMVRGSVHALAKSGTVLKR